MRLLLAEGDHTRTKIRVASKVGGLAAFTKKKETCLGCKTPLDRSGQSSTVCAVTLVVIDVMRSLVLVVIDRMRCAMLLVSFS